MNQIYPDDGLVEQLTRILAGGIKIKLFKTDVTPDRDTVLADLVEADWAGYAAVDLDDTDFTLSGVVAHQGYLIADPVAFLNSSGAAKDAYGYFVTNADDDKLLAVARFDGAPISKDDGESHIVVPAWGDFSELTS